MSDAPARTVPCECGRGDTHLVAPAAVEIRYGGDIALARIRAALAQAATPTTSCQAAPPGAASRTDQP